MAVVALAPSERAALSDKEVVALRPSEVAPLNPKKRFVIGEFRGMDEAYINPPAGTSFPKMVQMRVQGGRYKPLSNWATYELGATWNDANMRTWAWDQTGIATINKLTDNTKWYAWNANTNSDPITAQSVAGAFRAHIPSFGPVGFDEALDAYFGTGYDIDGDAVYTSVAHDIVVTAPNDNIGELPDGLVMSVFTYHFARTSLGLACYAVTDHGSFTVNHAGSVKRLLITLNSTPGGAPDLYARTYGYITTGVGEYKAKQIYFLGLMGPSSAQVAVPSLGPIADPIIHLPTGHPSSVGATVTAGTMYPEIHQGRLFYMGGLEVEIVDGGANLTSRRPAIEMVGGGITYTKVGYLNFSDEAGNFRLTPQQNQGSLTGLVSMSNGLLVLYEHGGYLLTGDFNQSIQSYPVDGQIGCDSGVRPFGLQGTAYTVYQGHVVAYSGGQVRPITEPVFPNVQYNYITPHPAESTIYMNPTAAAPLGGAPDYLPLYNQPTIYDIKTGQFYSHSLNVGGTGVIYVPTKTTLKTFANPTVFYRTTSTVSGAIHILTDCGKADTLKEITRVILRSKQGNNITVYVLNGLQTQSSTTTATSMGDGRYEYTLTTPIRDTSVLLTMGTTTVGVVINPVIEIEYTEVPVAR